MGCEINMYKKKKKKRRSRIPTRVIIIEASPDTTDDKLPRIGLIPRNIAPIEKPDKKKP